MKFLMSAAETRLVSINAPKKKKTRSSKAISYGKGIRDDKKKTGRSKIYEHHGQLYQQTIFGYQGCLDAHKI